ncbi:hypothetical protein [Streptomyces sp. NPDC055692]|uniref:hypothetical protein n=1 Tax=Streptomyces sp. NPDC055692 TaxID=3155683 RepID=UPI0034434265
MSTFARVKCCLTVAIDLFSRCVTGLKLTPVSAKGQDVADTLYESVRIPTVPGRQEPMPYVGVPSSVVMDASQMVDERGRRLLTPVAAESVIMDHGKIYMPEHVHSVCTELGISIQPARVYQPTDKAVVERFFRTLNDGILKRLPGKQLCQVTCVIFGLDGGCETRATQPDLRTGPTKESGTRRAGPPRANPSCSGRRAVRDRDTAGPARTRSRTPADRCEPMAAGHRRSERLRVAASSKASAARSTSLSRAVLGWADADFLGWGMCPVVAWLAAVSWGRVHRRRGCPSRNLFGGGPVKWRMLLWAVSQRLPAGIGVACKVCGPSGMGRVR